VTTDAIWTAFSARLRAFIAKRVRENVDIDDILQDVFTKIHAGVASSRRRRGSKPGSFR
jgi:DNA-directed RNA polymerase specialized sigma24 family protein